MTSISRYERFDNDGLELVIDTVTGESFATISGYARMAGLTQPAISQRVSRSHNKIEVKTAEIQTSKGIRAITLINEETISDWIIDDNPKLAKAMLKAGVRAFLHLSAGYTVKSSITTDHRLDPEWQRLRKEGKKERLNLTDETKAYVERHPELSPKERKYIYAAHSDALNRGLYGRSAKQLRECLGLKNGLLRDCFPHDEIAACQSVEEIAAWWIRSKDMNPVKAINKVIELIEYSRRFAERHHETLPAIAPKPKGRKPKALAAVEGQMNFFDLL